MALLAALLCLGLTSNTTPQSPYDILQTYPTQTGQRLIAKYIQSRAGSIPANTIEFLQITLDHWDTQTVRIRITDANNTRFEPPNIIQGSPAGPGADLYMIQIQESPMGITITRNSDGFHIFYLNPNKAFTFDNYDIFFTNDVNKDIAVMGFGQRVSSFVLNQGNYTMWARDRGSPIDQGDSPGKANMYSTHPFYVAVKDDGKAFGGFFLNANAQNVQVQEETISFRSTGGIIDYFAFTGDIVKQVIQSYHSIIGYPVLVPYWGLGWHQSRYGYKTLARIQEVVNKYVSEGIPLDVIWSDIGYMENYQDFTLNSTAFPPDQYNTWINNLNSMNKHFVPIVDAGIAQIDSDYSVYSELISSGAYIKDPYETNNPLIGKVWPGNSTFVDWLNQKAEAFWRTQLQDFHTLTKFSGIWLDMNQVTNFVDGSVGHLPTKMNCSTIQWCPGDVDLNEKSLDIAGIHSGDSLQIEFNLHSLWGHMEMIATNAYFTKNKNSRPFIISRSTFPGSGRYGSKWLGDNFSQWAFLEYSITGVFNFQIFGIPLVGADICGFSKNTTQELCSRWMQLGTMYPFSRNHNSINSIDQEPWSFGPTLLENSKLAIRNKYLLHLYYYTGMFKQSVEGGLFFKPAFFDYSNDVSLIEHISESFIIGESIIVHPCLKPGVTSGLAYFPFDSWFNFYTGEYLKLGYDNSVNLEMPLVGKINMHVKKGSIIPLLKDSETAMNLADLRKSEIELLIVLDNSASATGEAVFDDGLSTDTISQHKYTRAYYSWKNVQSGLDSLKITLEEGSTYVKPTEEYPFISSLKIFNCNKWPQNLMNNSTGTPTALDAEITWDYKNSICKATMKETSRFAPDIGNEILINYYF